MTGLSSLVAPGIKIGLRERGFDQSGERTRSLLNDLPPRSCHQHHHLLGGRLIQNVYNH